MRNRIVMGAWITVLALILSAPMIVAEAPADQSAQSEETSVEEPGAEVLPDLPWDLFEPEDRKLEPCQKLDGTSGAYYCTGEPCSNGLQCAQCCSGFGTNCDPPECVVSCFQM